jgi:hypothetical protein
MKVLTMQTLRSYEPCYDPSKYLSEDWTGTVLDIVKNDDVPWDDRLWVVMREDLLSDRLMRMFAVWCARQVQHLITDERSLKALEVAERFANGLATKEELAAARVAARAAAWNAAWHAARDAARDAAWHAAEAAARDAARDAAWHAASDAAWATVAAARNDAGDAARDARDAASDAAWDARDAAWAAQKDQLVLMILEASETGDVK